ncbi:hypothetical protein B0H14DRAFT_1490284 [Mycena olivaceomarginata]|nr:hypothetical protein B0H14DRAFT_1490284 [Mycena olivaceomarginata]
MFSRCAGAGSSMTTYRKFCRVHARLVRFRFVRCGGRELQVRGRGDVLIWCGRCGVLNVVSRARLSWVFVCFARARMLHSGGAQGVCASRGVVVGCGGRGRTCHRRRVFDARYFDLTFFFSSLFPVPQALYHRRRIEEDLFPSDLLLLFLLFVYVLPFILFFLLRAL